jgi:hypothetical protein
MIAEGCECGLCLRAEAGYEARRLSGALIESHEDGTSTLHAGPGLGIRLRFDPTAEPSQFAHAGGARPPGLAAKAGGESSAPAEPESSVEPEPPEPTAVTVRRRPGHRPLGEYAEPTLVWKSQATREREAGQIMDRIF